MVEVGPKADEPAGAGAGIEDLVHFGFPDVVSISCFLLRKPGAFGFVYSADVFSPFVLRELARVIERTAGRSIIPFGGRSLTK